MGPVAAAAIERPDLDVVARFLDRLWQPDTERTRSLLHMAVRVNYGLFRHCLALLEAKGFVGSDTARIASGGAA